MRTNHEEIDRLTRRLQWEGGGPLTDLSVQVLDGLAIRVRALVFRVREMADERPLISLLLAFQLGLAAGKWEPDHAQR
jgi:hypothetical protein